MKKTAMVLAAAGLVSACGGSDDNTNAASATPTPQTPSSYALAVRPHLGTMVPGGKISLQPLADLGGPLSAIIPSSGDPIFQIPAERCGPGLVTISGADGASYFSEATNQTETLGATEKIRALVPNICGSTAPVSVSVLDEIALHIPAGPDAGPLFDYMAEFQRLAQEMRDQAREVRQQERAAQLAALQEAAQKMRDAAKEKMLQALVGSTLNIIGNALPTPIGQPNTVLPSDASGLQAAMIESLMKQYAEIEKITVDLQANQAEAMAAMLAHLIANIGAASGSAAGDSSIASQLNAILLVDSPAKFDFASGDAAALAQAALGAKAAALAQDLAGVIGNISDRMSGFEAARDAMEVARTKALALQPVASPDMTLALRAALTPLLLRAEPVQRLQQAVSTGSARFACATGNVTRGTVALTFSDADNSGTLTADDTFQAIYDDCVVAEPVSGVTLTRTGAMNLTYDPHADNDIRLQTSFEMMFRSGETATSGTPGFLFRANGRWTDRAAFGKPGDVTASQIGSVLPVVLVDDVSLTLGDQNTNWTTQIDNARFDMTGQIATGGAGRAEMRTQGVIDGVFYGNSPPLVFDRDTSLRLTGGDFWFNRQAVRTGSVEAASDGRITTTFANFASPAVPTTRTLTWQTFVAAYLAPAQAATDQPPR